MMYTTCSSRWCIRLSRCVPHDVVHLLGNALLMYKTHPAMYLMYHSHLGRYHDCLSTKGVSKMRRQQCQNLARQNVKFFTSSGSYCFLLFLRCHVWNAKLVCLFRLVIKATAYVLVYINCVISIFMFRFLMTPTNHKV